MLIERLKAAVEKASELPADFQDQVAAEIESAIRNAEWDAQLDDPTYDDVLEKLISEAKQGPKLPFPTPKDMGDEVDDAE